MDLIIAAAFGVAPTGYSGSVEESRRLVSTALPGWKLHLGFDAAGFFPYASLSRGGHRVEARAPTVPLAILRAAARAWPGRA